MRYELSNKNTPRRPHCPACAQVIEFDGAVFQKAGRGVVGNVGQGEISLM
jgi:hypothetical protein